MHTVNIPMLRLCFNFVYHVYNATAEVISLRIFEVKTCSDSEAKIMCR